MMKKTYIEPRMDVVRMEQHQPLLSDSLGFINQGADTDGDFYTDAPPLLPLLGEGSILLGL